MRPRSGSDAKRGGPQAPRRIVERSRVSHDLVPVAVLRAQPLEPRVSPVDRRESVRLVDRHDAQPGEDRIALGLTAEEDHPRRLTGILDELVRRVHRA